MGSSRSRSMVCRGRAWLDRIAAIIFIAACSSLNAVQAQADDPSFRESQISEQLAAGEFGPALESIARLPDSRSRDAWYQRTAAAQLRGGARRAALDTVAAIGSDTLRSQAYANIGAAPLGNPRGGGAMADFDTLIELITSTVSPDSWDAVGGPGAIEPFPTGVLVDPSGLMKEIDLSDSTSLAEVRSTARRLGENRDARRPSGLRKVSLPRLEREAQRLWALGKPPDASMRVLAGLRHVRFVLLFPESGDLVLAGPAGDWITGADGRLVAPDDGRPVLQLDDLVVLLRNAFSADRGQFGCSIVPRAANLASVQDFLKSSAARPLKPSERNRWMAELRSRLGRQDIRIHGIDPRSRVARIIVEADYHMKLIGMGLQEGTLGVSSYLDSVQSNPDGSLPPLDVLRWWFTLNYDPLRTTNDRDAFELLGPGVRVQSENELLTERGQRVHTGKSDEINQKFAHDFTQHFADLAVKYPIYAELRSVFDLAMIAGLIRSEQLAERIDWHLPFFADDGKYQVDFGTAPLEVDSVVNYRLMNQRQLVVGVSGGVTVQTAAWCSASRITADDYGHLRTERNGAEPQALPPDAWWWD